MTQKQKKAKPKNDGIIEGKVVDDNGRPIANADVYVTVLGVTNLGARGASTDDSGKFRIKNLPVGAYLLNITAQGYVMSPLDRPKQGEPQKYYRSGEIASITMVKGGVITGKVTDSNGDPIVGIAVHAMRVRNADSNSDNFNFHYERRTDDRGIYRLYGLPDGRFVVYAGRSQYQNQPTAYDGNTPTYYPSASRDTASVVSLQSGDEATGIDIRFRGERGYTVSGTVKIASGVDAKFTTVVLADQTTNTTVGYTQVNEQRGFEFRGIADGEYRITAQSSYDESNALIGLTRITVKGADVSGLEVNLTLLASISGRVVLNEDPKTSCETSTGAFVEETVLRVNRDKTNETNLREPFTASASTVNNQGEFTLRNLVGNTYRLQTQLPSEDWFIQSIVRQNKTANTNTNARAKTAAATLPLPELIALKDGEKYTDLTINLSNGAAALRGSILPKTEGSALPANLRLYLVPSEKERADDTLRYAEAAIKDDGSFSIINLASGKYFVVIRAVNEDDTKPRPLAWDSAQRAKLRKDAEAANMTLELKPCQQLKDYRVKF